MNNLYGAPHCSLGPIVDENSGGRQTLFWHFSITKFARKLLNVRSPQALKFTEITALVPFSTPTGVCTQNRSPVAAPRVKSEAAFLFASIGRLRLVYIVRLRC